MVNPGADVQILAARLIDVIRAYGSVAVALSGGVDSAVVAQAAQQALGTKAVAVTAISPSLAEVERRDAVAIAEKIGIRHIELLTSEFARPEYRANAGDRCFYCKDSLYSLTADRLAELGVDVMANGANTDDLSDHRPGMQAAERYGVRSPLIEAELSKADVRQLARFWQLPLAEKPASPCLSSRIAYGVEVTEERVKRVEAAEMFLRHRCGQTDFRVRLEASELARIEVAPNLLSLFTEEDFRSELIEYFRDLGFRRVTLDLEGFRSGSMNDQLPIVQLGTATDE
ncbi:MAG: ATP-dependent sacrificial sulfur transferase LarE [Planctomycetaceae bacterium]|nr:ATP-dependent sacrificial sulfur transferase LarE [Planctomycetaceae bacterium]